MVSKCEVAKYKGGCDTITNISLLKSCFDLSSPKVKCPEADGYLHTMNYSGAFWSLAQDKEWICEDSVYAANIYSSQMVGGLLYMLVMIQLSDQ